MNPVTLEVEASIGPSEPGHAGFGYQLAATADLNEDGVEELLVGVPWIYRSGGDSLAPQPRVEVRDGRSLATLSHLDVPAEFTHRVGNCSSAPLLLHRLQDDFDADGVSDFGVSFPGWQRDRGCLLVVSSATCRVLRRFEGLAEGDACMSVVSIGDLNGDGCPDLALGCPRRGQQQWTSGRPAKSGVVRLVSGSDGRVLSELHPTTHGAYGDILLPLPDVDGDDASDLVVLTSSPSWAGAKPGIAVVSSKTGRVLVQKQLSSSFQFACTALPTDPFGECDLVISGFDFVERLSLARVR